MYAADRSGNHRRMSEGTGRGYSIRLSGERSSMYMMPCINIRMKFSCAHLLMNRGRHMRLTATQEPQERWESAWPPAARRHQSGDGHCHSLHGFHSHGGDYRQRNTAHAGKGLLPGSGHRRRDHAHHKARLYCKDVSILADTLRKSLPYRGFRTSRPVLVDVTKDVTAALCEYTPVKPELPEHGSRFTRRKWKPPSGFLQRQKPYIYVGGGAVLSGAGPTGQGSLLRSWILPSVIPLMGKGAFDGHSPLYTGG